MPHVETECLIFKIGKMNIFQRFWYTIFELISNKSNYRDMPYFGTTLVLFVLAGFFISAVIGYWTCFSVMCGMSPSDTNYSRILWYLLLSIPFTIMYFYNRKIGFQIIERFKNEDEYLKRKRRRETVIIVIVIIFLLIGSLICNITVKND